MRLLYNEKCDSFFLLLSLVAVRITRSNIPQHIIKKKNFVNIKYKKIVSINYYYYSHYCVCLSII